MQARKLIPKGHFMEVSFASLEKDPFAQIEAIYKFFKWPWTEEVRKKMATYAHTLQGFKKNDHVRLSPECKQLVAQRWRASSAPPRPTNWC